MKRYFKPQINRGIDAMYDLAIALEVWTENLHPVLLEMDKPQIFEIAKLIHEYFRQMKYGHWH